jgi:hypothetical protein
MPDSKLPAARLEQVLKLIHGFDALKRVTELTVLLAPAGR